MENFWPKKTTQWVEGRTLYLSVPFTWELPSVKALLMQTSFYWDKAIIGGPALKLMPNYINMPYVEIKESFPNLLQKINPLATKTTIGCINKCGFCGVPKIEGKFQELSGWKDLPLLCDNNLLAASRKHFNKVIDLLKKHEWCDFNQGIDARLLTPFHAARLAELKSPMVRLALDSMDYVDDWEKAYQCLRNAGLPKKSIRSYALIGFESGPEEAWQRCEYINAHGVKVLPQWFHSLRAMQKNVVTLKQERLGWTEYERTLIMQYYYQRGKRNAKILSDYGWRLKSNQTLVRTRSVPHS